MIIFFIWPLSFSLANIPLSPETAQDQERRIRREIANSNERRRMQSINAGFQSLKTLLPHTDGEKLSKVLQTCTHWHTHTRAQCCSINQMLAQQEYKVTRHKCAKEGIKLICACFCTNITSALEFSFCFFPHFQAAILQQTADYIFTLEQEKTQLLAQNNQLKRFIQVTACLPVFLFFFSFFLHKMFLSIKWGWIHVSVTQMRYWSVIQNIYYLTWVLMVCFWGQNNPYGFVFSSGSSPGGDLNVELIQITDMYNRI